MDFNMLSSHEFFIKNLESVYSFRKYMYADSRTFGNFNETIGLQKHRPVNDIFSKISGGFRSVTGKDKTRKGLKMNIENSADSGFQHAA